MRKFYADALKAEPKLLIDCLIKEIVLYDDKIEIYFNSPIKLSPDESRGFTFYTEDIRIIYKDPHRSNPIVIRAVFEIRIYQPGIRSKVCSHFGAFSAALHPILNLQRSF